MSEINHLQQIINEESDKRLMEIINNAFDSFENLPDINQILLDELLLLPEAHNVSQFIRQMKERIFEGNKDKFRKEASREVASKVIEGVLPF